MAKIKINIGKTNGVDNAPRFFKYNENTGILSIKISKYNRSKNKFIPKLLPIVKKFKKGTKIDYKGQEFNFMIFDKK